MQKNGVIMAIEKQQLEHLARLANLEFGGEELEKFKEGFEEMVAFCDGINHAVAGDTSSIRGVDSRTIDFADLREDTAQSSLAAEKVLSNGQSSNGSFTVRRVVK